MPARLLSALRLHTSPRVQSTLDAHAARVRRRIRVRRRMHVRPTTLVLSLPRASPLTRLSSAPPLPRPRPRHCLAHAHATRAARVAHARVRRRACVRPTTLLWCALATVRRHETTNEMTTSEMTTSETSKTSEKKYQTSGCACGPKNCETKRPSAQARDPKSSKRTQTRQELCHLLRYTDEMRETSKASETKHEASGCACEPHELRAPRTAEPKRPRDRVSDQEPKCR